MTRKLKASILLLLFAVALAAAFFGYRRKLSNTRAVLAEKSAAAAQEGSYAEASRLIDRALQSPEDGSFTDEQLYLKKAEYTQQAGDNDQALSIAMRVVKNTREGQPEFDEAWERIVSICIEEEEVGKLAKFSILRNSSARFGIYKKLRIITLRKRIACNARFGKRIIVVFYADVLYHRSFFGSAKIHFCKQKSKEERKQVACLHRETN